MESQIQLRMLWTAPPPDHGIDAAGNVIVRRTLNCGATWRIVEVTTRRDLRFSPNSTGGFLFGADPAFPSALVDLGLVVVALSRHVVDALALELMLPLTKHFSSSAPQRGRANAAV